MRQLIRRISSFRFHFIICLGMAVWCVPASAQDGKPLFYPPLPDAPRIQYLTSFSVASDVKEKEQKKSGWLSNLVLGEEDPEDNEGPNKPYGVSVKDGQIHVVDTRGAGYAIFDVPGKDRGWHEVRRRHRQEPDTRI